MESLLKTTFIVVALTSFSLLSHAQPTFTNVGATSNTDHGNTKDGGIAWGDFNNDGCLDLVINTSNNTAAHRTRLLYSDCSLPNPTFSDVTNSHATGLNNNRCERSVSVGDYNNDGYLDMCRNTHNRVEVYINKGPTATPAYSLGNATQNPNFTLTAVPNGMNVEGFGWMDYNNDGWLDLILENHNYGIDIYENPADGTSNFFHVTPNATPLGLPTGGTDGDYMVLGDYNDDGYVDIFARKRNERNLWTNDGDGTFTMNTTANPNANNSNKGGVLMCDFDNDGDFDLFWSDQGTSEIYQQTGLNSGNFVATGEPGASSATTISNSIDGCDCGDIDNDGDIDLFLGGSSGANSYLFTNDGGGTLNFTRAAGNYGIVPSGNTEGLAFADYDNDGDLDLYIQVSGQPNELWQNDLNDNNYLKIHVLRDLSGGAARADLGATVVLKDCAGNVLSGIRQVGSVMGHGCNAPSVVHFGLPAGNTATYLVEIRYTDSSGTRIIVDTSIYAPSYPNQTVTIYSPNTGGFDGCFSPLPIELLVFNAQAVGDQVRLDWTTATEINNDYFTVERSLNGYDWEIVGYVEGAGNSTSTISYVDFDPDPHSGVSYYRLKQTDYDGTFTYSDIKAVSFDPAGNILIFPNPAMDEFTVTSSVGSTIQLIDPLGRIVELPFYEHELGVTFDVSTLARGLYIVRVESEQQTMVEQLIIE